MAGQQSRECHNQTSQDGAAPTASSFPRSVHQTSLLSPACHIFPRIPTDALIISVFSLLADLTVESWCEDFGQGMRPALVVVVVASFHKLQLNALYDIFVTE